MKIAHLADCHLGYKYRKKLNDQQVNIREQDGYDAFEEAISQIIEAKCDIVVIAGDLFHMSKPSVRTVLNATNQLRRLKQHDIPCFIITGNHDTSDIKNSPSASTLLHFPELGIWSYEEPLVIKEIKPDVKLWLLSHQSQESQKEVMENMNPDENSINILVTHGSCYDSFKKEFLHTENEPREVILSENVLNMPWTYILLGHIHSRGWVDSEDGLHDTSGRRIFYNGSLIRRGFADKECPLGRGWTEWNLDINKKEMTPTFHYVKQRPQRELLVDGKDKTSEEIFQLIKNFIDENNMEEGPILRVKVGNVDKVVAQNVDTDTLKELTKDALDFSIQFQKTFPKENETVEIEENFTVDLVKSWKTYFQSLEKRELEKEIEEEVERKGKEYIIEALENI